MSMTMNSSSAVTHTASIPAEIRERAAIVREEIEAVAAALQTDAKDLSPASKAKLHYAEQQNCTLHFLSPDHEIVPSFSTVAGLSLCPECVLHAAAVIVNERLSQAEIIELAIIGSWLDDGSAEAVA
ncbi:hypothetical protein HOT31_gp083 [Microbacterium phage Hendrix]|uniref:Uncharacterized protein n=1 Tax=Microbacterium phage Hendrix TaxID=2182341 RepID=A0A2U8UUA4_9CAUD|nr:hypothetical protein HOT31_gp083 [Microbacterium phage Hendrix]AWN07754.1 hypothetical protein PBI_HENDRIX_83 [Microbacterium phage Hendrix]